MLWFLLLLITGFLFFAVSIACLPFICASNRLLAIRHSRSLYDKSAYHLAVLGSFLFIVFGITLFLDYYLDGIIFKYFIRPKFLNIVFLLMGNLFLLGGMIFFVIHKRSRVKSKLFFVLNVLVGGVLFLLTSSLTWVYLRSTIFFPEWTLTQLWTHEPLQTPFLIFMLVSLFLGLTGAHILALIFFIIRRNKDDYGRDYYTTILASHAKRATYSGVLLCVAIAVLLFIIPTSYEKLTLLLLDLMNAGFMDGSLNSGDAFATVLLSDIYFYVPSLLVFIPLSIICLQVIAKSALPLQRKSFAFFALLLLFIGLTVLVFRLWY